MRRGEAWKALRERGGWMRMSERVVFYVLLERSDNADCSIPATMTPSLVQLADACCCSKASVKRALNHLERHGWLTRTRVTNPGRGHKTGYQLAPGVACPSGCPHQKGAHEPLYDEKGAHEEPQKGAHSHRENPRSTPVLHEGITEGEEREGEIQEPEHQADAETFTYATTSVGMLVSLTEPVDLEQDPQQSVVVNSDHQPTKPDPWQLGREYDDPNSPWPGWPPGTIGAWINRDEPWQADV
jgi:hypothetical protein